MASTAVGLFFTALAGAPIAIGVQFVWWFADSMGVGGSGAYSFLGVRPLQLAPRHNALGDTAVFMEYAGDLLQNRVWISLIALALVWLTVLVFMAKRRGFLNVSVFKRGGV